MFAQRDRGSRTRPAVAGPARGRRASTRRTPTQPPAASHLATRSPVLAGEAAAPAYEVATPRIGDSDGDRAGGDRNGVGGAGVDGAGVGGAGVDVAGPALDALDAEQLVALAGAVLDRLAAEPLSAATTDEALAASVQTLVGLERRVGAEWHRRVGELETRGAGRVLGCRTMVEWLAARVGLTRWNAKRAVTAATVFDVLPETAAAFAAGRLDAAQVHTAVEQHAELARLAAEREAARAAAAARGENDADEPGDAEGGQANDTDGEADDGRGGSLFDGAGDPDATGDADGDGGNSSRGAGGGDGGTADDGSADGTGDGDPDDEGEWDRLRAELDRLVAEGGGASRAQTRARLASWRLEVDERLGIQGEQRAWRDRSGSIWVDDDSARGGARFTLDAVGVATVKAALEPLARKADKTDGRTWRQRMADALVTVCQHALDSDDLLPETAGGRPQIIAITTRETPEGTEDPPPAWLDGVGPISSATAEMLACDGCVTEVVVNQHGQPLQTIETGRVTIAQRQALIARDRGCVGCGAPVSQTQVHHIVFRRNHGATAISNLLLVCWTCHRHIHHHGWQVIADAGGYRIVAPWDADASLGIRQPVHCGRQPT